MSGKMCQSCGKTVSDTVFRCPTCREMLVHEGDRLATLACRVDAALGDGYQVEELIGRGGAAVVFSVQDVRLERSVAVKVLRASLTANQDLAARFQREARTSARLNHPNIVPIFFVGDDPKVPYFVMPLVQGETLGARIQREGQLPVDVTLSITRDIAHALDFAHGQGVIHRDVKPENIMLDLGTGRSILMDFGIAKAFQTLDGSITESGMVMGTPYYIAPEQAAGDSSVNLAADIYSLGVVIFEMLAGEPPFVGKSPQEVFAKHMKEAPPALTEKRSGIPRTFSDAISRALAKNPEERYESAGEMFAELTRTYGRRSLRTSGSSVLGERVALDPDLFRALDVQAELPVVATLLRAESFGTVKEAVEGTVKFILECAKNQEFVDVIAGIHALRFRARDHRPPFRDAAASGLERVGDDPVVVDAMVKAWSSGDDRSQAEAQSVLSATPGLASRLLDRAIRDRSAELMHLAERIGAVTDDTANMLAKDERLGVVDAFVTALAESTLPSHTVERRLAKVLQHPREEARILALRVAALRGGKPAERVGRLALGDSAPSVRVAAITALGRSRQREVLPELSRLLNTGSVAEQLAAVDALGSLAIPAAVVQLQRVFDRRKLFRKERGAVQEAAAQALARMPLEMSGDFLSTLESDPNPRIASVAKSVSARPVS